MIKKLCRNIFNPKTFITLRYKSINNFSTKLDPQQESLQDWQYVQAISREIKNNDINEALKYVIQSHLNKKILNKQIFYSLHEKMQQLSAASGYHEILYKLYRQNFHPNSMTLKWMKKISKTQNSQLLQMLKLDYQKLNETFPLKDQVENKQKSTLEPTVGNKQTQIKSQSAGRKSRKVPTIPTTDDYFSKAEDFIKITKREHNKASSQRKTNKTVTQNKQYSESDIQLETITKLQGVFQKLFTDFGKITLHNVELEFDNELDESLEMYDELKEIYDQSDSLDMQNLVDDESQDQTIEDYVLQMLSSISKIKIGRVELVEPNFIQDTNNQTKHKDDHKPQKQ